MIQPPALARIVGAMIVPPSPWSSGGETGAFGVGPAAGDVVETAIDGLRQRLSLPEPDGEEALVARVAVAAG